MITSIDETVDVSVNVEGDLNSWYRSHGFDGINTII